MEEVFSAMGIYGTPLVLAWAQTGGSGLTGPMHGCSSMTRKYRIKGGLSEPDQY
jgi:hypothetical protein